MAYKLCQRLACDRDVNIDYVYPMVLKVPRYSSVRGGGGSKAMTAEEEHGGLRWTAARSMLASVAQNSHGRAV
ncbi:MAG: hypothetical protein GF363_07690 [Chitinivibrionales bacterium]|nr:hypothetical protein [Chitinivibrionales bacterium]